MSFLKGPLLATMTKRRGEKEEEGGRKGKCLLKVWALKKRLQSLSLASALPSLALYDTLSQAGARS